LPPPVGAVLVAPASTVEPVDPPKPPTVEPAVDPAVDPTEPAEPDDGVVAVAADVVAGVEVAFCGVNGSRPLPFRCVWSGVP
jgi:hypothetical protein